MPVRKPGKLKLLFNQLEVVLLLTHVHPLRTGCTCALVIPPSALDPSWALSS
jgi:hypothetical protein